MTHLLNTDELWALMEDFDHVSFDVFDTLLYREGFAEPHHLFYQLAREKDLSHGPALAFMKSRMRAEAVCRERRKNESGHMEVHLKDIYQEIGRPDISAEDEMQLEKRVLRPRPFIRELHQRARAARKKVYAISDFYLDEAEIETLLRGQGYEFDAVYTSCSQGCGKYNQGLFSTYLTENSIDSDKAFHIGDNWESDYLSAISVGITAHYEPKPVQALRHDLRFNQDGIKAVAPVGPEAGKASALLLAWLAHTAEQTTTLSQTRAFATQYAIPLVFQFSQWLLAQCQKDGVRRLHLMARDGYMVEKVLELLSPDVDFQVVKISRRAVLLPAAVNDRSLWDILFTSSGETPIKAILEDLALDGLDRLKSLLPEGGKESFDSLGIVARKDFLEKSYDIALPQMRAEGEAYLRYANEIGLFSEDSALVDVGWFLSSHRALEILSKKKLRGYYLGSLAQTNDHEKINSFLFNRRSNASAEWQELFESGVELLELPFVSTRDQVVRLEDSGFIFRRRYLPDQTRSAVAMVVHRELEDFFRFSSRLKMAKPDFAREREWLEVLFSALIKKPTKAEYCLLSSLPHDRYIAGNRINSIRDYWVTDFTENKRLTVVAQTAQLIRKLLLHIRLYGLFFTAKKVYYRLFRRVV